MSVYWQRKETIGLITLSAIRSDTHLHANEDSRAEIMYQVGGGLWQDLWSGSPTTVTDVLAWAVKCLRGGFTLDEIENEILERPWKYGVLGCFTEEAYNAA